MTDRENPNFPPVNS
jgi:hypothetical protein